VISRGLAGLTLTAIAPGPAHSAGRGFDDGVAEALVVDLLTLRHELGGKRLLAEHVEAVELQIVCRELWHRLPADATVIRREHLTEVGRIDEVLARFYDKAIEETAAGAKVRRRTLRRWFDRNLITPAKTRGIVFQDQQSTAGLPNAAVKLLEERRVIRSESRDSAVWYELSHDRLVDAVIDSNRKWAEQRESFRQRQFVVLAVITVLALVLALYVAHPPWLPFLGPSQRSVSIEDLDRSGEIRVANREDQFRVHGSAGSIAILSVLPDGELDTSLRLLTKNGSEVANDPADGRPGSHIAVPLRAGGEYQVRVAGTLPGRYHLRGGVVDEETPAAFRTGTQFNHRGEVDVYTFRLKRPGVVLARMHSQEGDLHGFLELVGPDNKLLAASDDSGAARDPFIAMFVNAPGTYRVEASAASPGKGHYEIRIEHGEAPQLGTNQQVKKKIGSSPGGEDQPILRWYTFKGEPGKLVIVHMKSDDRVLNCYLRLFGPKGDLKAETGNAKGLDTVVASDVSDPGSYVVVASARHPEGRGSEGYFRLSLRLEQL
jgi:hypothetical protein